MHHAPPRYFRRLRHGADAHSRLCQAPHRSASTPGRLRALPLTSPSPGNQRANCQNNNTLAHTERQAREPGHILRSRWEKWGRCFLFFPIFYPSLSLSITLSLSPSLSLYLSLFLSLQSFICGFTINLRELGHDDLLRIQSAHWNTPATHTASIQKGSPERTCVATGWVGLRLGSEEESCISVHYFPWDIVAQWFPPTEVQNRERAQNISVLPRESHGTI